MTKKTLRIVRTLDLAQLAAATGGMQISTSPKLTWSTGSSSTNSTAPTSVTTSPSTSTSTGPQINGIH